MQKTKNDMEQEYSVEMQDVFYAEELEDRFEFILASPNLACWITDL